MSSKVWHQQQYQQKLSDVPKPLWYLPTPSAFCVSPMASPPLPCLLYYLLPVLPPSGILSGPHSLTPPRSVLLHLTSHTSSIFTHITYHFAYRIDFSSLVGAQPLSLGYQHSTFIMYYYLFTSRHKSLFHSLCIQLIPHTKVYVILCILPVFSWTLKSPSSLPAICSSS